MSAITKLPGNLACRAPGQMLALEPRYLFDAAAVTTAVDSTTEAASNDSTTTSTQDTNEEGAVALVAAIEPALAVEINDQGFFINENLDVGQFAAQIIPAPEGVTFTLIDGLDSDSFAVSSSGEITVADSAKLNFEDGDLPTFLIEGEDVPYLTFQVEADDGESEPDIVNIFMLLRDVNDAPSDISATPSPASITLGQTASVDVSATDEDNNPDRPDWSIITFELLDGPEGASIDQTGQFAWTPTEVGTTTITVAVSNNFSDNPDLLREIQFQVTAEPVNTVNDSTDTGSQSSSAEASEPPPPEPIETESEPEILAEEISSETESEEQQVEEALEPPPAEEAAPTETSGSEAPSETGELTAEQIAETESFIAQADFSTEAPSPAAGSESESSSTPADAPPPPKLVSEIVDIISACGG